MRLRIDDSPGSAKRALQEYTPTRPVPAVPPAPSYKRVRPLMRMMRLPYVGGAAYFLVRYLSAFCPMVSVRTHTNNFFFRSGELRTMGNSGRGFAYELMVSVFRPSLRYDRGNAAQITSSDDMDNSRIDSHDANDDGARRREDRGALESRFTAEQRAQYLQELVTYDEAFGFERFWDGAARGLTLVGLSPVHGRGLFALNDIPKGTLVISPCNVSFLDAVQYTNVLGVDPSERMARYGHYAHHSGGYFELPFTASAMHFINHSCEANLRAGFLYRRDRPAGDYLVEQDPEQINRDDLPAPRYREDPADLTSPELTMEPHSLVANRDIKRGEELFLDYAARVAPRFPSELGGVLGGPSATSWACRCGRPTCRGVLQKGAESWRFYSTEEKRRVAVEDALKQKLKGDEEFHDDEFTRASLMANRSRLFDLLYGPLCNHAVRRTPKHFVKVAMDGTVRFLNTVEAERDFRP